MPGKPKRRVLHPLNRGFTLVEVMIAVVIVGLLAALVMPTVSQAVRQNSSRGLNRQLAQAFQDARSYAMGRGEVMLAVVEQGDNANSRVRFFRSTNQAMSCADAAITVPAPGAAMIEIELVSSGTGLAIAGVDPAGEGTVARPLCISPAGRVLDRDGRILHSDGGCPGYNFRFWLADPEVTLDAGVEECPARGASDDVLFDLRVQRQLSSFTMIHVPFNGQARVIQ
ncbi:pilus assembly FimT family protein [Lujinxingia litoralis]|nr:type II secretion system protein [Lujinxingia litoralis]